MWSTTIRKIGSPFRRHLVASSYIFSGVFADHKRLPFSLCTSNQSAIRYNHAIAHAPRMANSFGTDSGHVKHRLSRNRKCGEEGCSTTANYGWRGGRKEYCAKHKKEAMVLFSFRLCEHEEACSKQASFGVPGGRPSHCSQHKHPGMKDVKNQRCIEPGCPRLASCGVPGGRRTYCGKHKKVNMEDLINKRCQEPGCTRLNPCFGLPGGKGIYCGRHKKPQMIDVRHKRCEDPGCSVRATYGYLNDKIQFCVLHKHKNMVTRSKKTKTKTET